MVAITGTCEACGGQVIPGGLDPRTLKPEADRCLQCGRAAAPRCETCGHLPGEDRLGRSQQYCRECA